MVARQVKNSRSRKITAKAPARAASRGGSVSAARTPAKRRSPAARGEAVSYMNQVAGAVQRSGQSVARTMEDPPMALLAGVGFVGFLLALFFGRSR